MPDQPRTPQFNLRLPSEDRAQLIALAKARNERDLLGSGASAVVRRLVKGYLSRHRAEIPDNWRDYL